MTLTESLIIDRKKRPPYAVAFFYDRFFGQNLVEYDEYDFGAVIELKGHVLKKRKTSFYSIAGLMFHGADVTDKAFNEAFA